MADTLTAAGLAALHDTAEKHVANGTVPGLVALVASGDDVHVETAGQLSIGGPPMARDSLFRIASMTKPVTGAATMALIQEGLIGLDEPVDRLLPELADRRVLREMSGPLDDTVPARRAITTRDLLTFTFGFGFVVEMFMAAEPFPVVVAADAARLSTIGPPDRAIQPDQDTWMAGLGSLPLIAQPGERWMYNTGASVLGVLLSRAAGLPFREVLRTRIFEPLGMTQTAFWATDLGRLATVYRRRSGNPGGTGRTLQPSARVRGWRCRPGVDCRRHAGVRPDVPARRRPGLVRGIGPRDDDRSAHARAEGLRRPRA